jgi:CheY-like chemotaxis protein
VLIQAYLKDTGCVLDIAENGAIALARLKAGEYDLALMDIQMPVMDGLETTRLIRDWERERGLPRMPILALTASAVEEDVRRALEAGIDMHVSKPIRKAVLIAAIKKSVRAPATHTIVKTSDGTAA